MSLMQLVNGAQFLNNTCPKSLFASASVAAVFVIDKVPHNDYLSITKLDF